ncbi:MAG: 1-deoxy-D-xylulose-5-phosphate reductoisomerase [Deltaproteobacteria bacterium]|nr:1-deoxy-D-xylulose-5-phosphate reductoisomerase [Deltaproteobacteria bacterium]MBW2658715.1 1-deoxy-D-xylulose-5-phosphate reductoisomerase [Deltaproteobacteria bacterium]
MKYISLLGATGSIGTNVLAVVRKYPQHYTVVGMSAGRNVQLFAEQVLEFQPEIVSIFDDSLVATLAGLLPHSYRNRIVTGVEGNKLVAAHAKADMTVSAIVGAAGLLPTLAAIEAGKDIGLANKETLVMAGKFVMDRVKRKGVRLFPIDSEHSAIFQALEAGNRGDLKKIILTASGGPFRGNSPDQLRGVTREQALAHPNWNMGRKVSIDSATLMNKGLEVIEAKWLFDVEHQAIEVVVHPQSIVHSLVEFVDGSVIAQMGIPDMMIPISYALSYPRRLGLDLHPLQLSECANLEFVEPDYASFPALKLAFEAVSSGGVAPAVLNAANEIAVEAFLNSEIQFPDIAGTVARTMDIVQEGNEDNLEDILQADKNARREALSLIA